MIDKRCDKVRKLFSPYFDGVLDRKDTSKLEEHIAICDSCKKAYASYSALFEAVRAMPSVEPSGDFDARLFARIRRGGRAPRSSWWWDLARIPLPSALGAAALLLLAVFSYTRFSGERSGSVARVEAERAVRPGAGDSVRTRRNTLPSFLGELAGGEVGRTASIERMGPPRHLAGRVIHENQVPRDMNGVPLEGPYLPGDVAPGPAAAGGAVDTFSRR